MSARRVDHLLIGGGLAAASCARRLRDEGADGSILVVGREPDPPYNRPSLSKKYLAGREQRRDVLFRPDGFWEERSVELLTRTSVMKLDPEARVARLSTGEEIEFGTALIATGANVRRLRGEGGDLEGIHYLRTFGNADAIRADVENAERVACIGGSYIGAEVAATLTSLGRRCAIVMMEDVTLSRPFGEEIGGFFQRVLEERGVEVHGGQELERFEGSDGRVRRIVTKSGLSLECDLVVVGAGVMPDVMLARSAGLELGETGGIRCSSRLEASVPGIYAAGDVCEYDSVLHGRSLRIEHWDVALAHGRTAALNMLGRDVAHEDVPYFFSDLADWSSMEYLGPGTGDVVIRGSLDDGAFSAFWVDGERVTAALSVGRPEDLVEARRFIVERTAVDATSLADESSDLAAV